MKPRPAVAKPLTAEEIRKEVAADENALKLWETVEAAEAGHKAGNSEETKQALIKAHFELAEYVMLKPLFESPIPESKKYLIAYQAYRRILQLNPKHAPSKSRVQTIVNIYIIWGKPLP